MVAAAEAPNHTSKNDNAANTAHGVAEAVLTKLQNEYGVVGDELANARTAIKAFVGGMNGNNADWKNFSQPDQPQERTYGIRIVRDIADLLLAPGWRHFQAAGFYSHSGGISVGARPS